MKILHPNNKESFSLDKLNNYLKDGIYEVIDAEERNKLNYFLTCFEEYRLSNNLVIKDESLYKNLPFSLDTEEWKVRQKDILILEKKIKDKNQLNILDVSSWNGWLSNYLSEKGHKVSALNLFIDEYDGLKSKKKYDTTYLSFQINVEEIFRIKDKFDLIIFNRNWAFINNKQKVFNDAKKMLTANGEIVFTGLSFYNNPTHPKQELKLMNKKFKTKYKIPIVYNESKGYHDADDFSFFSKNNITLYSYQKLKNFIKLLFPKKARVYCGSYKKVGIN
jgi:2-polyprenyl-3-methyl-5-hydroxy-6-metoxy-1,4-benzoquinol methylase